MFPGVGWEGLGVTAWEPPRPALLLGQCQPLSQVHDTVPSQHSRSPTRQVVPKVRSHQGVTLGRLATPVSLGTCWSTKRNLHGTQNPHTHRQGPRLLAHYGGGWGPNHASSLLPVSSWGN